MKNRYKNPWHNPHNAIYGPEYFEHDHKPYMQYRGYTVYKKWDRAFDIVKDGVCITQRAGCSKEQIDRIADGNDPHIDANGKRHAA